MRNLMSRALLSITTSQPLLFLTSFVLGALLALALKLHEGSLAAGEEAGYQGEYDWAYERWLEGRGLASVPADPDLGRYGNRSARYSEDQLDPASEAAFLFREVKVFCLVFPTNAGARIAMAPDPGEAAAAIRATWGKRCNKILFYTAGEERAGPVVRLPSKSAFGLLCESLRRVVAGGEPFDWLLVTTETTFALPENLRHYVAPLNSSEPHYLGHAMKFWNQVYNWGEAGYALSQGAVSALLARFDSSSSCQTGGKYWKNADWYLGKHLAGLGVAVRDTRDHRGRGRFNGYSFRKLLFPGAVSLFERYWKDSLYLSPDGPKCCSSRAVTFQGILSQSKMYQLEFLFHHLRPFAQGGSLGNAPPPGRKEDPFLTEEERLKHAMMQKWFDEQLMTTPSNLLLHNKPAADY